MSTNGSITRGPIAYMAGNSVASNLIMLAFLLGGFIMLHHIKQEVFPDTAEERIDISVSYPGASPEEVEDGVILAIEEAVRGIDGVEKLTSVANEGRASISIELVKGSDVMKAADDVQGAVDRVRTLPVDSEDPVVEVASRRRQVVSVILYGDTTTQNLYAFTEQLRDVLLQSRDVTQVEVTGLPDLEIEVAVPEANLRRYDLTLGEVAERIASSSLDLPGGAIKTEAGEVLVRLTEKRHLGSQFGEIPIIAMADGSRVLLKDIATITDGFEDSDRFATFDGKPSSMIEVYRVGNQTPIQVSEAVREQLELFQSELPDGIHTRIQNDRSEIYQQRLELLVKNGMLGLVLVLIVLGLFLEFRLAFWVMLGIPISFMGSFLLLPAMGVSINMITMFAYIIALGIVVDDAIIVGENIYHLHQDGMPFRQAAVQGAREVAMPVTFSILTNIVCFMPLFFIPGMIGRVFGMIPMVVGLAFAISLIESLFILPAHLGHQRDRRRRGVSRWLHGRQQAFSNAFRSWIENSYGPFLGRVLAWRYASMALAFAVLFIVLGYAISGRMGFDLFPKVEADFARASAVLPFGSPVDRTVALSERLIEAAYRAADGLGHPEIIDGIFTEIGRGGSHDMRMDVNLVDVAERDRLGISTDRFANAWREAIGEVAGVESLRVESDSGGPGGGRGITVQLSHRNLDTLQIAADELADELVGYSRVKEADSGFQPGKPQFDVTLTDLGRSLGLSARDVARQVRNAYYGAEAIRQQRGRSEILVMVRLPHEERSSQQTVEDLMIRTPTGNFVPLREVVATTSGRAFMSIDRTDGRRVVQVTADVVPRNEAHEVLNDLRTDVLPVMMDRYPGLTFSFEGRQAEMRDSLGSLKINFALAMLVVFGLLAIPFRSYLQPLIIMIAIPFGVVGAIIGHLIMGYSLSIISILGIVALAGVVVNGSLVLIDFTNHEHRVEGKPALEAIRSAAVQRFRPILLTTLTTFGGLAPMIFETSRQARFMIPMAISLGFGIVFGTVITLLIIPCLYMVLQDVRNFFVKLGWLRPIVPEMPEASAAAAS